MPRVIVTTDPPQLPQDGAVLLDERVHSVHLSDGHAAAQLIERLAWAISDAEETERGLATTDAPRLHAAPRRSRTHSPRGTRRAAVA